MQDAGRDAPAQAPRQIPWRLSLRTRLVLWSSLTSVLLLVAVAAIFYVAVRGVLLANARTEMRGLAQQSAGGLSATLESVEVSGRTLAGTASGLGRQPLDLRTLMTATLEADPDIVGVMVIIEPGRLAPDDPGFDWYRRRQGAGYFESTVRGLGEDYQDYRTKPWYARTVGTARPWWGDPYANDATGGELFVTYNLPLFRTGETAGAIGMVSLDVPVRRLRTQLGELLAAPGLVPMLFSPEQHVVLHADPSLEMQGRLGELMSSRGRADLAPLLDALQRRLSLEFSHEVPRAGGVEHHTTFALPLGDSGWAFALGVPEELILAQLRQVTLWGLGGGLLGVVLCVLAVRRRAGMIARPIEDLTDSARHLARGEFDYPLGHTARRDEVGVMARAFDSARTSIKQQIREIAEMASERQKLESELDIARDIQLAMLPAPRTVRHGGGEAVLGALLKPAKAVGGDFYTFFDTLDGQLWFVIGDVSDKGVPAALFMARTVTVLEVAARLGGSPARALAESARHLVEGNDTCMFATVACGKLDLATGALEMASAGHEPPVMLRRGAAPAWLPLPGGPPLGFEADAVFESWTGRLEPGDGLVLYTDGVTEAFDLANVPFGEQRLLGVLGEARGAAATCEALLAAVQAHAGEAPQSDDITLLALCYQRAAGKED
ncbi:SpoIIE family protein phosphatase [Arenimonas sp. SCN 70-307]|uniref:SpoIIE family protein phosphatase n=1 Tax=Arenimonas sp. SCN 70-307 TaxID=1660089 RepID=UPI0025C3F38A|nr:SpoIIE family protein phosphatase [Arenimonas sp. SCN 70-307]